MKVYHFYESKPGIFEKNKPFYIKNNGAPFTEYTAVNNFCWNVRAEINLLFQKDLSGNQNMSNKEKKLSIN